MINTYLQKRKEDKQAETIAKTTHAFAMLVTGNCPIDLNKDRKAKKLFQLYLVGVIDAICAGIEAPDDLTVGMTVAALRSGVMNGFYMAECDTINYSESSIQSLVRKLGKDTLTKKEDSIVNQGFNDLRDFILYKDTSVTENFYYKVVLQS